MNWRYAHTKSLNISPAKHHLLRSVGFTTAAMFLYVPANLYPFLTMKFGHQVQYTTIWDGIRTLFDENMWITATIVLMASIIVPIFKLLALFFINLAYFFNIAPNARWTLLLLVDFIGRWAMLDIFLLAIMVAVVKFGAFATVSADMASYLLGFVVILTMLASATLSMYFKDVST